MKTRFPLLATGALAASAMLAGPAGAQQSAALSADLQSLNTSDATGRATVSVRGDQVTVNVQARGLSPGVPHAQHLHIGGTNTCPTAAADANDDGFVGTAEGQPAYGAVKVSLTTEGDVSDSSALAVERFPVARDNGTLSYTRTFTLPEGVTEADVRNAVVVQHGISKLFGDPAAYDGDAKSSLDESLPLEATIPATCGRLVAAQVGQLPEAAPAAGFGGTAGDSSSALLAAVGVAALGGTTLLLASQVRLRRASSQ